MRHGRHNPDGGCRKYRKVPCPGRDKPRCGRSISQLARGKAVTGPAVATLDQWMRLCCLDFSSHDITRARARTVPAGFVMSPHRAHMAHTLRSISEGAAPAAGIWTNLARCSSAIPGVLLNQSINLFEQHTLIVANSADLDLVDSYLNLIFSPSPY